MNFWLREICEMTFICTGRVVWALMDTLPPRDQIPKHCWWGEKILKEKKKCSALYMGCICLELRLSVFTTKMRRWGFSSILTRETKKHMCFLMWRWTLYRRIMSCICLVKPLWRVRKVKRHQNMELLSGPRWAPLSAETKHLLKHWTFAISLIWFKLFMLMS